MSAQSMSSYFFMPNHIILVGASERPYSLGERILSNLLSAPFQGQITPVNLRHRTVAGLTSYTNLNKIPGSADLVIAVTPPDSYDALFKSCRKKQFGHIILIQDWESLSDDEWHTAEATITTATSSTSACAAPPAYSFHRKASTSVPNPTIRQATPPF